LEDRLTDGLGQVVADGEVDLRVAAPVREFVRRPGGVGSQQQLDLRDVLDGDLRERQIGDRDLISGGVRARAPGTPG
jgi:hypothetical protein